MDLKRSGVAFAALYGIKKLRTGSGSELPLVCRGTDAVLLQAYPVPSATTPTEAERSDEYWVQAASVGSVGFPFPSGAHVSQEPAVPPGDVAYHAFAHTSGDGTPLFGLCVTEWRRIEKRARRQILRMQAGFLPMAVESGAKQLGNGYAVQEVAQEIQQDDAQVKFLMSTPAFEPVSACVVINVPLLEFARAVMAAAVARRQRVAISAKAAGRWVPIVCPALAGAIFADVTVAMRAILTPPRLPSGFGKRDYERAERLMVPVESCVFTTVSKAGGGRARTIHLSRWAALGPLLDNGAAAVKEVLMRDSPGDDAAADARGAAAAYTVGNPAPGFEPAPGSPYAGYDLDLARLHDVSLLRGARARGESGADGSVSLSRSAASSPYKEEAAAAAGSYAAGAGSPGHASAGSSEGLTPTGQHSSKAQVGRVTLAYPTDEDARAGSVVARTAALPLVDVNWEPLLSRLSPRNILRLLNAILYEKVVLLVGRDLTVFIDVALAAMSLCQPLEWAGTSVPTLPPVQGFINVIAKVGQLIVGMHPAMLARATSVDGKVFAPPGPPPPLGDPRNMLPSARHRWERWTGTLSRMLKLTGSASQGRGGASDGAEAAAFRALRSMWPLSVDEVPSTSGIPLSDVVLSRDRRRRRKALRRAATWTGLKALVVQGLADPSALESDRDGQRRLLPPAVVEEDSDSAEADSSDAEGAEGVGEAGRAALPSRGALHRLAEELGMSSGQTVVDLDHDWVSNPDTEDAMLPARLTMRLYRALALHGGATAHNLDTFEHVVSQPDLPASTTGAERNGLVRDTSNEVQFVCYDRAHRSEALTEADINLGTAGRGKAGAPVVGVHVCREDVDALRGAMDGAGTGESKSEDASAAAPTEAAASAPRGFLAKALPCARVKIDTSLSGQPLRLLSKSAQELSRQVHSRVAGDAGGVGSTAGEVDEEGMSPIRHGGLKATGHGSDMLYKPTTAFERMQLAGVGAATASIIQGEVDEEVILNAAPKLDGVQRSLGPTGPQESERALAVGIAFADEEEAATWAAVRAAAKAYDAMPRSTASIVGDNDRARLFPVRSNSAHLVGVDAPWKGWRDRLLRLRFYQSLEVHAPTNVDSAADSTASEEAHAAATGSSEARTAAAGAPAVGSVPAAGHEARTMRLARQVLVYPDEVRGTSSDQDDEETYGDDDARGLRWDDDMCGGDNGTVVRRCVRRLLAAVRPSWWRFRSCDRNPDAEGHSDTPGSSAVRISAGHYRDHESTASIGEDDEDSLSQSLDSTFIPVPAAGGWDDDDKHSGGGPVGPATSPVRGGMGSDAAVAGGDAGGVHRRLELPKGCSVTCKAIASLPQEGRLLLTDADEAPSAPRGWRPDVQLLRVIAGSTMVTLLRSFRLYIREEPLQEAITTPLAARDSDGSVGRPKPSAGILRLDDLRANLRAAFDRELFVAEQPTDMEGILNHFANVNMPFLALLHDRVAPERRTSDSAIRRLKRTGEVPRSIDWFDLWCFERMQTSVKKLAAVRESDFEGELYMARRGSAARSFQSYYVRLVGNVLVWYRDPARIFGLQTQRKRLRRAFKQAPGGSAQKQVSKRAYEEAGRQLKDLMGANYEAYVQIGRNSDVAAIIKRKKRQLEKLYLQIADGSADDVEAARGAAERLEEYIKRREEYEGAAQRWEVKCVTLDQADLPTPFPFQLIREAKDDGKGVNQRDMLSLCAVHYQDRRDLITRLRARLQSQEYLEQLRNKYMSPSVGETTRVMLSGNLEYLLARRTSQAASMAGGARVGIAASKLGADASAAPAGGRGAAPSGSKGPASGAGSAAGAGPGEDPKAAAWLSGRVRWSYRSDSGPIRVQMLAAGRELEPTYSDPMAKSRSSDLARATAAVAGGEAPAGTLEGQGYSGRAADESDPGADRAKEAANASSGPQGESYSTGGIGGFFQGMFYRKG